MYSTCEKKKLYRNMPKKLQLKVMQARCRIYQAAKFEVVCLDFL